MRILVLGDTNQRLDEGAKNVAHYLTRTLGKRHEVLQVHQREALRPAVLGRIRRFRPGAIMSVQGPSPRTVILLRLLKALCPGTIRTIVIGAQPSLDPWLPRLLRRFPPDAAFAQSLRWLEVFRTAGLDVERLPNGVSIDKFDPDPDPARVAALRSELGIAAGAKVALHIGPLNANRNHELLIRLQRETDWQVLVIGSETAPFVPAVARALVDAGVVLVHRYLPDIGLAYALADVYVFPVEDPQGSIEFPLTVLEAMACDRPVASTRFLALPEYLHEGPAFGWFDGFDELAALLPRLAGQRGNLEQARGFAWERVAAKVERRFGAAAG